METSRAKSVAAASVRRYESTQPQLLLKQHLKIRPKSLGRPLSQGNLVIPPSTSSLIQVGSRIKEAWPEFLKTGIAAQPLVLPLLASLSYEVADALKLQKLVIEYQALEVVFKWLKPCKNLQAVFLKGNRIITRDLPYMVKVPQL